MEEKKDEEEEDEEDERRPVTGEYNCNTRLQSAAAVALARHYDISRAGVRPQVCVHGGARVRFRDVVPRGLTRRGMIREEGLLNSPPLTPVGRSAALRYPAPADKRDALS